MPKFKVKTPIMLEGKTYSKGETIELDKDQAESLSSALENPPKHAKSGDKDLQAAMDSQNNRPDPWSADWKVDKALQEQRKRDRAAEGKEEASERTAEEMEEEAEETKPPMTAAPATAVTRDTSEPGAGGSKNPGPSGRPVEDKNKK